MTFSVRLRELLNEKGMKPAELARVAQISEAVVSEYLSGKKEPRGRQSIAIAKALEVSLDKLWETEFQEEAEQNLELMQCLNELRNRPEMQMLFKVSKNASKEEIEKVVQMIEAFKRGDS